MGDDCQANIAPELTLRPKTMRRVHGRNNESAVDGSPLRNRSQQTHGSMSSAFGQHRLLRLSPQRLELIQLFIQPRDTLAYSGFRQRLQPSLSLFGLVDSAPWCLDAARAVDGFDPGHRALGIDRERLIGTNQLL